MGGGVCGDGGEEIPDSIGGSLGPMGTGIDSCLGNGDIAAGGGGAAARTR